MPPPFAKATLCSVPRHPRRLGWQFRNVGEVIWGANELVFRSETFRPYGVAYAYISIDLQRRALLQANLNPPPLKQYT